MRSRDSFWAVRRSPAGSSRRTGDPWLDRIYSDEPEVDAVLSEERWVLRQHRDVARFSRDELRRDLARLRRRLRMDDDPLPWLLEWRDALRRALGNRAPASDG